MPNNLDVQLLAIMEELKVISAIVRPSDEARAIGRLTVKLGVLVDFLASKERDPSAIGLRGMSPVGRAAADGSTVFPERGDMGMPSVEAVAIAAELMRGAYVNPETADHPAVKSGCVRLAFELMAYGLVPNSTTCEDAVRGAGSAVVAEGAHVPNALCPPIHRVLVVDDMSDVLVTVGAFLSGAGFAVERATSGDEALGHISAGQNIDALVTDFAMPGLNGSDLILQAMRIWPGLRALLITGYPNADGLSDLPSSVEILVKPFRRDKLIAAVKSLLAGVSHSLTCQA